MTAILDLLELNAPTKRLENKAQSSGSLFGAVPAYISADNVLRNWLLARPKAFRDVPIALPEIMLGVNQRIMLGLSMLVIAALVGTRDLGQEVYMALTKADTGRGLVAGVCVALIAMIADRLISAWSIQRKKMLGLS